MTVRKAIALTLLAVLAVSSPLQAADDSLAENAALAYYQAYLFLPNLDDAKKSAIKEAVAGEKEISKNLVAILDESEIALHQMHRGARLSKCVWGTEFEAGPNAMLAHVSEARELAKIACLRARYRFEQGNASAGVDDVVATLTLARHCSRDGVLVAVLVDYAIEDMVIGMAEGYVPSLSKTDLEKLSRGIGALPETVTMTDSVLAEKAVFGNWLVRVLRTPNGKAELLKVIGKTNDANAKALVALSSEELAEGTNGLLEFYDKLAEMAALPSAELQQQQRELFKNLDASKSSGLLARVLAPAVSTARKAEEKYQTRLATFKASVDVALSSK
jgi:hypothetical protein